MRASVRALAAKFFVSEMTVRRDLKEMEKCNFVRRYNGGAVYGNEYDQLPIQSRILLHTDEKKILSQKVRKYLADSMTVYIDSSSTALYILHILAEYRDITIVTNSVRCVIEAAQYHIKCIMVGGEYYEADMCNVGGAAIDFLSKINVDVGFFSAAALSDDGVISDRDEQQTAVRMAVMKNCGKKIFAFDSSKQHKKML